MEARPAPDVYDDEAWELAGAYRVTLWERAGRLPDDVPPREGWSPLPDAPMGWAETTFELVGCRDVREAIQWAEAQDRGYVIYARMQGEDRWLQVAGWPPVLSPDSLG
ncbi:MAG TPA: hypothetical protein VH541_04265 [Gaiellaceae bacterium]